MKALNSGFKDTQIYSESDYTFLFKNYIFIIKTKKYNNLADIKVFLFNTMYYICVPNYQNAKNLSTKYYKLKNQVMKKIFKNLFLAAVAATALASCTEKPRNTEELIDPWLRERTPVNVRLESQIGAAIISDDWRNDAVGSVSVSLITGGLDLTAVKVVALDFEYPDSEYCPVADIKAGDTLDLSDGSAEFTVTSYNGETRTYTLTYSVFTDPLEGCYSFTQVGGILDGSAPKASLIMIGGFEGFITLCQVMDKWWQWGTGYMPTDEDDNILSFRLENADAETGATFGTVVNTPGADGKFANYKYQNNDAKDINEEYRLIPTGKSRWAKLGDGFIGIYAFEDENYTTPLYKLELLEAGAHTFWGDKVVNVPSLALHRSFGEGPFNNQTDNWNDERWYVNNIRNVFWLIQKDSDSALENHGDLLAQ